MGQHTWCPGRRSARRVSEVGDHEEGITLSNHAVAHLSCWAKKRAACELLARVRDFGPWIL